MISTFSFVAQLFLLFVCCFILSLVHARLDDSEWRIKMNIKLIGLMLTLHIAWLAATYYSW